MTNLIATALMLIIAAENADNNTVSKSGARGVYQEKACIVYDVNRIYGTSYKPEDAHDPIKAKNIAVMFLTHQIKLGVKDADTLARIWACGRHNALSHHAGFWYVKRAVRSLGRLAEQSIQILKTRRIIVPRAT